MRSPRRAAARCPPACRSSTSRSPRPATRCGRTSPMASGRAQQARPLCPGRAERARAGAAVLLWRQLAERQQEHLPRLRPGLRQRRHRRRGRRLSALSAGEISRLHRGRRAGLPLPARDRRRRMAAIPARIFVSGHSAGAYIAAMLGRAIAAYLRAMTRAAGIARRHRHRRALRFPAAPRSRADRHLRRRSRDGDPADQICAQQGAADAAGARHRGHDGRRRQFAAHGQAAAARRATRSS